MFPIPQTVKNLAKNLKYRNELDPVNLFEFDPHGHLFTMIFSRKGNFLRSENVDKFSIIVVEDFVTEGIKLLTSSSSSTQIVNLLKNMKQLSTIDEMSSLT